ncbi:MAG: MBL fold metallo-hydrolase, partial [Cyclobacteriaceae bacterium]
EITDPAEPQLPEAHVDSSLHITYINHATFLVQTANSNILTDPIFSERASPFQWAGPKRMRPPGIKLDQVPEVDMVFISHNHYDHLDEASVKSIYERDKPLFIVPLGVGKFLNSIGITNHVELDWWEDHQWKNLNIQSVPAQHFSGRGMFDRDKTLWAGYMLETPGHRIYFAGDTGYREAMFRELGERAGNPDVALLPLGAYRPRWFMSPIHVSPAEALKIHFDVKAGQSIAMHYGTFPLADEGQFTPVKELDSVLVQQGLNDSEFIVLPEGQRYIKN